MHQAINCLSVKSLVLLLAITVAFLSTCVLVDGATFEVRLFSEKAHEGRHITLKIADTCVNLPAAWDKKVSSVEAMGCIILYSEPDCKGNRRRLQKWSWASTVLKDVSFEDMVSSISKCPESKIVIPDEHEEL